MPKHEVTCDCTVIHKSVLNRVKEKMPAETQSKKTALFFKALGDATRAKIVLALSISEMCVCDLSVLLNMTKSAVSHQLAFLKKAGFVKSKRAGKLVYYSLADKHISSILKIAVDHINE